MGVYCSFAGMAIFLRNIKPFLIFSMLFALSFGFGRHIIYRQLEFESTLFSSGIRIDAVDVVLIMCYVHWGLTLAGGTAKVRRITLGGKIGWAFSTWIGYVFLASLLAATNILYSMYEIIVYIKGFLLYFYLINNINEENELKLVVFGLFSACAIQALYLIFQYITKTNYTILGVQSGIYTGTEGFRSAGFYGSPDAHSVFLVTIFPIFLLATYFVRDTFKRFLLLASLAMIIVAILFTQVRIAIGVLGECANRIGNKLPEKMDVRRPDTADLGSRYTSCVSVFTYYLSRFLTGTYGEERWPLIITAYNMFKSNILFGVGANDYNFVVLIYSRRNDWKMGLHSP